MCSFPSFNRHQVAAGLILNMPLIPTHFLSQIIFKQIPNIQLFITILICVSKDKDYFCKNIN